MEYKFPLEIVINNFFNGDLDLKLNLFFDVNHNAADSVLDVTIAHSVDVNFHWLEDALSFGNTASIAKTAEELLPLIIESRIRDIELSIINLLRSIIGLRSDTHRLLDVRLIIEGNHTRVEIILYPLPEEQNSGLTFDDALLLNDHTSLPFTAG